MRIKLNVILTLLSVCLLVFGFQNCTKTDFTDLEKGGLVAKASGDTELGNPDSPDLPLPPPVEPPKEDEEDNSKLNYVCILEGPGKSVKVAFADALKLAGKNGTPGDVCMSENACLNIISQVFEVKEAARRGFCPNKNPHVVSFSDERIQALVDALK